MSLLIAYHFISPPVIATLLQPNSACFSFSLTLNMTTAAAAAPKPVMLKFVVMPCCSSAA